MTTVEIIAQVIGFMAMGVSILSYQFKTGKQVMTMQIISGCLWTLNLALLSAVTGVALNVLGLVRAAVFANRKFFRADHIAWPIVICTLSVASYALPFTVFYGMLYAEAAPTVLDYVLNALPIIGMVSHTIAFYVGSAAAIRKLSFVNSPCWGLYHLISGSYPGALNEVITLVSVTVATIRYRGFREEVYRSPKKEKTV